MLWTLPDRIDEVAEAEARPLAHDLAAIVRALMLPPDAGTGTRRHAELGAGARDALRRARRLAMEAHVEARLDRPDLGVADLCRG